jgi:hypothetical protein
MVIELTLVYDPDTATILPSNRTHKHEAARAVAAVHYTSHTCGWCTDTFRTFTEGTRYVGYLSSPFFRKPVAANPPRRLQLPVRFRF